MQYPHPSIYIYIYLCIYLYVYIDICIHTSIHGHTYYGSVCVYTYIHICATCIIRSSSKRAQEPWFSILQGHWKPGREGLGLRVEGLGSEG